MSLPKVGKRLLIGPQLMNGSGCSNQQMFVGEETCDEPLRTSAWEATVGVSKLNSLMKKMAEKAGLGPNVKNHSSRKTMIRTLTNNDIPATDIIQLSKSSKCDKLFCSF